MIGGVDEAGRGAAIGPLVISLVIPFDDNFYELPLRDSKRLSKKRRESLFFDIFEYANVFFAVAHPFDVDRKNLNKLEFEMVESLLLSVGRLRELRMDAVGKSILPIWMYDYAEKIVYREKADEIFPEVAAASITAKVVRDSVVKLLSNAYGEIGSGYLSDVKTQKFIKEKGIDMFFVRKKWFRKGFP